MTRITNNPETIKANRRAMREATVQSIMNPYTLLSAILIIFGLALVRLDAKGVPILLLILTVVAVIRLLYSIRSELRRWTELQSRK